MHDNARYGITNSDHQCESVDIETSESDNPGVVATVESESESELESVTEEKELLELLKEGYRLRNMWIAKSKGIRGG